jgi:serine kinase of HPr protein (carbohydrate metabolism regulator)
MIYVLAIRQLLPGKMAQYKEVETKELIPVFNKYGIKMVGHWNTIIGNSYETVNLFAYNDMAHYQKSNEARRTDPESQKMAADLGALTVSNNLRLLEPSEWSPLK